MGSAIAARRREEILDAATAILVEDGHARLSTRTIAARAGIRVGHLQYYYRAKADVVRAMLARWLERAARGVEARICAASSHARLRSAVDGILADQRSPERGRFFRELWALAAHDGRVDAAMRAFYDAYWRQLVGLLVESNPALGRPRAERRAALLIALVEGLTLFRSPQPPHALPIPALEKELHALLDRLVEDAT